MGAVAVILTTSFKPCVHFHTTCRYGFKQVLAVHSFIAAVYSIWIVLAVCGWTLIRVEHEKWELDFYEVVIMTTTSTPRFISQSCL